ncbi:hypothetical protein PR202_gb02651 [Eleusine coracana subsp. coracana]|uniref:Pentatricopeptide repeat-containing protein n=1 Tax=Eleusine coracana subsp. coracana TaxID=191504 RepID=A0AAV5DY91_ELECO|nr:hypothetical protein QOZ80_8BG0665960 [Eleusine coracana subsp. coracana]GJN15714.1 hypothetical protein PR202_gb02651 [Eleusine coracana subsp. coracana]
MRCVVAPPSTSTTAAAAGRLCFPPRRSSPDCTDLSLVPTHANTPRRRLRATARDAADDAAALMVARAEAGDLDEAQSLWTQLLHSSAAPRLLSVAPRLLRAYARLGRPDEVLLAARELSLRSPSSARAVYPLAVSCLGDAGELASMEAAALEMGRRGLRVGPATGDAFLRAYAAWGTVPQMEAAYRRHKRTTGLVPSAAAIRAVAAAYIARKKYFKLGAFARDAGMERRRDVGTLLWNLYLLSFAANFRMKSLQRVFLEMVGSGPGGGGGVRVRPDLTTFNVRAAAFSKMCMFWDLHLTADHMRRDGVAPDLVTHGCFVDAYVERRLARNLTFAFDRLGHGGAEPVVATDGIVFEAFGKGGFHASSEALMESAGGKRRWTYYKLLGVVYLSKTHRRNQVFWNY